MSIHFSLKELIHSDTAKRDNINNTPTDQETITNLTVLMEEVLEPMREWLNKPIHVSSGYRSKELNTKIGGVPTSQHVKGEAADITCSRLDDLFEWACENLDVDQIINERKGKAHWIHVSFKNQETNRNQHLTYNNGVYKHI